MGWGVLLVVSVTVLGRLAWAFLRGDLEHNDQLASVVSVVIGLASLVVAVVGLRQQPSTTAEDADAPLDQAAEALATAVKRQWEHEADRRELRQPAPLRLTWTTTPRPVAATVATITGGTVPGRVTRLRLHGHLGEVAEKFLALPRHRLVVLGAPGGGKTVLAVLLTLELLARRQPGLGQPVPVLLDLASWNPTAADLHAWIAHRLEQDYPALRRRVAQRMSNDTVTVAQELVIADRILPVLDGLDELPEALRAAAIGALDRARGTDKALVVTCRSQEYQQAVTSGGKVLSAAAVVELEPVAAAAAVEFLRAAAGPAAGCWDGVAETLRCDPAGALAGALSTPLMVALARTVYTTPDRDPGELVTLAATANAADGQVVVERHLLDAFVPAAFADPPAAPDARPVRSWDPQLACGWLRVLARYLDERDTRDLAWWQLVRLVPRPVSRLVYGLANGLVVVLVFVLVLGLEAALESGVNYGHVFGLEAGLVFGLTRGFPYGLLLGLQYGLLFGLIFGLVAACRAPTERLPARVSTSMRGRAGQLAAKLVVGLVLGFVFGLVAELVVVLVIAPVIGLGREGGLEGWPTVGLVSGFVVGLMLWLRSPVDDVAAATPRSAFQHDKASVAAGVLIGVLLGLPIFGLVAVLGLGLEGWFVVSVVLEGGLVFGFVGGLASGLDAAWSHFIIVRVSLGLRGRLPWRLMTFLSDAHHRGVLRQAGTTYQFRHARLQDHLANAESRTLCRGCVQGLR